MEKTCSNGYCIFKTLGNKEMNLSYGCSYVGYCDYQRPRDSRMQPFYQLPVGDYCLCAGEVNSVGNCMVCGKKKQ